MISNTSKVLLHVRRKVSSIDYWIDYFLKRAWLCIFKCSATQFTAYAVTVTFEIPPFLNRLITVATYEVVVFNTVRIKSHTAVGKKII